MRWLDNNDENSNGDKTDFNQTMKKFLPTDLLVTASDIIFF
jgi:valyl-tRNA synthetase